MLTQAVLEGGFLGFVMLAVILAVALAIGDGR